MLQSMELSSGNWKLEVNIQTKLLFHFHKISASKSQLKLRYSIQYKMNYIQGRPTWGGAGDAGFESKIKAALFISGVPLMITMIIFSRFGAFCSQKLYLQFTLSHIFNRNTFILHLIYFTFVFTSVYIVSNNNLHNNTTSPLLLIGNTSFQFSFKKCL